MEYFEIEKEYIELNKLLKATGISSTGGMANNFIEDGLVMVDGEVEYRKGRKIKSNMVVSIEDQMIKVVNSK